MALEEREEVKEHLEDVDESAVGRLDDRKTQAYSNLFFMLQSEPRHLATLCRLISLTEIDGLLQTIMCVVRNDWPTDALRFTIYGNQYDSREENRVSQCDRTALTCSPVVDVRVRPVGPVRDHDRVRLAAARQHACLAHDDDVHAARARAELPQGRARRADQFTD